MSGHATDPPLFPAPEPDLATVGYWEAARAHRFSIQRCLACHRFQHFPAPCCSTCRGDQLAYERVSGRGTIYSYVVVHHVVRPWFEGRAPYVVAWIELPEQAGLRVLSDLVEARPEEVKVGMEVEVVYDDIEPGVTIPRFRPLS